MLVALFYFNFDFWEISQKSANIFTLFEGFNFAKVGIFLVINVDGTFLLLWVFLMLSMLLNLAPSPIYRIINLAVISLIMVFIWGYSLDFTFILLCYVIAFTSAVVMLFLSVVLMLPASLTSGKKITQNGAGLLIYVGWFSTSLNDLSLSFLSVSYTFVLNAIYDLLLLFLMVALAALFLGQIDAFLTAEKNDVFSKLLKSNKVRYSKYPFFLTSPRVFGMWDVYEVVDTATVVDHFFNPACYKPASVVFLNSYGQKGINNFNFPENAGDPKTGKEDNYAAKFYIFRSSLRTTSLAYFLFDVCFEFFGVFVAVVDCCFKSSIKRHLLLLNYFKVLSLKFAQYATILNIFKVLENLYVTLHKNWEEEKLTYPSALSSWESPLLFAKQQNLFVKRVLPWWSPFQVFNIFRAMCLAVSQGFAGLKTLKNRLIVSADALMQSLFIVLLFIVVVPVDFNFSNYFRTFTNAHNSELKVVNFDGLVELKHLLYEDMPLFMFVSVILLLIALLSVSILKKK